MRTVSTAGAVHETGRPLGDRRITRSGFDRTARKRSSDVDADYTRSEEEIPRASGRSDMHTPRPGGRYKRSWWPLWLGCNINMGVQANASVGVIWQGPSAIAQENTRVTYVYDGQRVDHGQEHPSRTKLECSIDGASAGRICAALTRRNT